MQNNNYKILDIAVNFNYVAGIDIISLQGMQDFEYNYFNIYLSSGTIRVNNYKYEYYEFSELVTYEEFVRMREDLINAFMNYNAK